MDSSPIVRVAAQVAPDAGQEQAGDGLLGLHPHREAAQLAEQRVNTLQ